MTWEHLDKIILFLLGGSFIGTVGWAISLKTQLRKIKNERINSNSDTTDKSLEVSMKLIATNEMLQNKLGEVMQQLVAVTSEASINKEEVAKVNRKLERLVKQCNCDAINRI